MKGTHHRLGRCLRGRGQGHRHHPINLAAATATYQVNVLSTGTLPNGPHNVKIVRSASSAAGKYLTLDAVDICGHHQPAPGDPHPLRADQHPHHQDRHLAHLHHHQGLRRQLRPLEHRREPAATIKFTGTRLDWIAMKGTHHRLRRRLGGRGQGDRLHSHQPLPGDPPPTRSDVYSTGTLAFGLHTVRSCGPRPAPPASS